MLTRHAIAISMLLGAGTLGGCASGPSDSMQSYPVSTISNSYGVIDSIQIVQVRTDNPSSGAGALVGGLVGGILGHQVGHGTGNSAATVAGAVGGAVVGNNMEQNNKVPQVREMYQITVHMDNGAYQTVTQDAIADMRVGSRVHIENNRVYRS